MIFIRFFMNPTEHVWGLLWRALLSFLCCSMPDVWGTPDSLEGGLAMSTTGTAFSLYYQHASTIPLKAGVRNSWLDINCKPWDNMYRHIRTNSRRLPTAVFSGMCLYTPIHKPVTMGTICLRWWFSILGMYQTEITLCFLTNLVTCPSHHNTLIRSYNERTAHLCCYLMMLTT